MNSQLNNQNDANDQVFQEESFRTPFFDKNKRACTPPNDDSNKRARLDESVKLSNQVVSPTPLASTKSSNSITPFASLDDDISPLSPTNTKTPSNNASPTPTAALKRVVAPPLRFRRFRSRSLPSLHTLQRHPIYIHNHNHHNQHHQHHAAALNTSYSDFNKLHIPQPPPLPPVNLQSLKEIDLHEILKNPQLRHDILFDPQLQFRPNLDGERGKKKKAMIDKYWDDVQKEIADMYKTSGVFKSHSSRLPGLFNTLREILLSLLPSKDRSAVYDVMDTDLLIQQLTQGTFDFVSLARWLASVFKSHCAPMRDSWVAEMTQRFVQADEEKSVSKLVNGLRMIFSILEAMKLDVANHQIRILRPVLIETAVDFERDYFNQIISRCKLDISDSLSWFKKSHSSKKSMPVLAKDSANLKNFAVASILDLLSCRNMVTEFPSTLTFDHTRLVLLRADIRQLVCSQLCVMLYKQLVFKQVKGASERAKLVAADVVEDIKKQVLSIVTDDNGNVKWTRNVNSVALQLTQKSSGTAAVIDEAVVEFSHSWLMKQIQPSSEVYSIMEQKMFGQILATIVHTFEKELYPIDSSNLSALASSAGASDDIVSISTRIGTLAKFHWNVFASYYSDAVGV